MFEDQKKDSKASKPGTNLIGYQWRGGGQGKKFETPEDLLEAAQEYFQWVLDNPLEEEKAFGTGFRTRVNKVRPMTQKAMCIFMGISSKTYHNYKTYPEFEETCQLIDDIIFTQKFENAAAGLLNASLIATDLGMARKLMHGSDPDNPLPSANAVSVYELPDNGRD